MGGRASKPFISRDAERHELALTGVDTQQPFASLSFREKCFTFEAVFLTDTHELIIYFLSAWSMSYSDEMRFAMELITASRSVMTTVSFTKKRPFCVISCLEAPIVIRTTSRKARGFSSSGFYAGIYNMGLTCYMASALQLLASFTPFVQLLFDQAPDEDTTSFQLQRVFGALRSAGSPISIREFITSFGKRKLVTMVAYEQDAHEFILNLFDKIDKELGKDFENKRMELLGVTSARVIECKAVNKRQVIEEKSSEIQVPVAGYRRLYDSLKFVTAKEKLTGDNQWDAGDGLGRHDAVQYMHFSKLPPFLTFQLCRFAYDPNTGQCEEVRSSFDCPLEIDMRQFCTDDVQEETRYVLMAVIAHKGSLSTGHYIIYLQPKVDGEWFRFNDEDVQRVGFSEVRRTFGKQGLFNFFSWSGDFLAYVVGYIRKDCIEEQMKPLEASPSIAPCMSRMMSAKFTFPENLGEQAVFGVGKRLDWEMEGMSIEDLVKSLRDDLSDYSVFVGIAHVDRLFGPVSVCEDAASYTLSGSLTEFFFVPKEESDTPVFFLREGFKAEIISKAHLSSRYSKDYSFDVDIDSLVAGSLVRGTNRADLQVRINGNSVCLRRNWRYEDIQALLADGNEAQAAKIVLSTNGVILRPEKYPTVTRILKAGTEFRSTVLAGSATARSLSLFQEVTVVKYGKEKETFTNVVPKGSQASYLFDSIRVWFNIDKHSFYVISVENEHAITEILTPSSRIPTKPLRLDVMQSPPLLKNADFEKYMKSGAISLEVRVVTYTRTDKITRTLGFHKIEKGQRIRTFYENLQSQYGDISNAFQLRLGGASNFQTPITLSPDDILTNVIMKSNRFSERFVVIIQMNEAVPLFHF